MNSSRDVVPDSRSRDCERMSVKKSEEAWGRCKAAKAPECNALEGQWRCSSLDR